MKPTIYEVWGIGIIWLYTWSASMLFNVINESCIICTSFCRNNRLILNTNEHTNIVAEIFLSFFLSLAFSLSTGLSPSQSLSHMRQGAPPTSTSTATSWYSGCRVTTPNTPCRGCQVKHLSPATLWRCAVSPLSAGPSLYLSAWLCKANSPDCLPLPRLARFFFLGGGPLSWGVSDRGRFLCLSLSLSLALSLSLSFVELCVVNAGQ